MGDPNVALVEVGLARTGTVCAATLDLFAEIHGAEAGNLALKGIALGGDFVGGGIAPRLLSVLQAGGFMRAFTGKGRFAEVLSAVPVRVARSTREGKSFPALPSRDHLGTADGARTSMLRTGTK